MCVCVCVCLCVCVCVCVVCGVSMHVRFIPMYYAANRLPFCMLSFTILVSEVRACNTSNTSSCAVWGTCSCIVHKFHVIVTCAA